MPEYYKDIIVRTYIANKEQSKHKIRAKPWPGQGFPQNANVECCSKMRASQPEGSNFKIRARITDREGGTLFIYSSYHWGYEVLTDEAAQNYIDQNN